MTSTLKYSKMLLFGFILFSVTACAPAISSGGSATETVQMDDSDSGAAGLTISSLELIWPETVPPDTCRETFPAPEISLCIQNQGSAAVPLEQVYFSLPAGLLPGALEHTLASLPGGSWMQPETIIVTGIPGVSGELKGIVLENKYPENFGGIQKIVVVDKIPDTAEGPMMSSVELLIFPQAEGAGNIASGIAIGLSREMGITTESITGPDGIPELNIVEFKPPPDDSTQAIAWGGKIFENGIFHDGEFLEIIPLLIPPPDDGKQGVAWGGIIYGGAVQEDNIQSDVLTGFPAGFDIESMMPLMREGGSDSNPYIFGRIQLQDYDFPTELEPGENSCATVPLILPALPRVDVTSQDLAQFAINGNSPGTSEIDFLSLGVQAGEGNDGIITKKVKLPSLLYTRCEPGPEISTAIPILATPTPTRKVAPPPPTPTTRTGLPTKAPGGRSAPTNTPAPPSRNN